MTPGYDGRLFLLVFDHRGEEARLAGLDAATPPERQGRPSEVKQLIWEGLRRALDTTDLPREQLGALVDEEHGSEAARAAKEVGLRLAMPVEAADEGLFDFAHGEEFGRHIDAFAPDLAKVRLRWSPDDDPADKKVQAQRLSRLSAWLHETDRKLLLELDVPDPEPRHDATLRAIREIRELGSEPDLWALEAPAERAHAEALAEAVRDGGRDHVVALVHGHDEDTEQLVHALRAAAPVEGYAGFAVGPPVWGEPVAAHLAGELDREAALTRIGDDFSRLVGVYTDAAR